MPAPASHTPASASVDPAAVTQVTRSVRADSRAVPAQEQRIAAAVLGHLGALTGISDVAELDPRLAGIVERLIAPTANKLAAEMREAGWIVPTTAREVGQ